MWGRIALFELRYQLRRPIALISCLVFAALAFGLMSALAAYTGKVYANAPASIARTFGLLSILGMFLSLATLADVALRDTETKMDAILRTKPVSPALHLGARFAGAYVIAALGFIGVAAGLLLAQVMPWVPAAAIGPHRPLAYLFALAVLALPNLFITGALFFMVASLTRSLLATYLSALGLFIAYVALESLFANPGYRVIGAIADPFGMKAYVETVLYWSNAERNTRLVPLSGLLLANRLLWIGAGAALLAIAFWRSSARVGGAQASRVTLEKAAVSPIMRERPVLVVGGAGFWDQLAVRTRHEITFILRSWTFMVLLAMTVVACSGGLLGRMTFQATPTMPVTHAVVEVVAVALAFVILLIPIAYGGELIWRDRGARIAPLIDATPTPTVVFLLSKIAGLAVVILMVVAVAIATGVAFQWAYGTDIDIGFYLAGLVLPLGLPALMYGVLAILIQTTVNQKFVGLLIMIAVMVAIGTATTLLGLDNELFQLFTIPDMPLSDMNRYGPFLARALWLAAYWTCLAVLVALAAYLIWARGTGSLLTRIRNAHRGISPAVASIAGVALAGMAITAGYITWNTRFLNEFATSKDREKIQVAYEKAYAAVEKAPQPRVTALEVEIDLYPERRGFESRGRYSLVNRSDKPIESVHVAFGDGKIVAAELQDADRSDNKEIRNILDFRPRSPFLPGETRILTFTFSGGTPGFQSGSDVTPIMYNGSFAQSSSLAPTIGVQRSSYLQSTERRRTYGLEPLPGMARRDDATERRRNLFSHDSDLVRMTFTVSTSADQTALAPGNLEREWTQGNRRFFRYTFDKPVVNFWSVVSARYVVARDTWNDVELAVYHDPRHGRNVPRMIEAMKQALTYYTANFGPFPHRQLRIAEYPRYQTFAQSFPGLVPYSEAIGFIYNLADPGSIDFLWHVTAHETAHQWWGHQIIPANVEGAQFLSESISEYSALMVAEHRYGAHKMRQYLKHELDTYLRLRGNSSDERPLARAAMDQFHVHYQKGALALYALRDAVGEATINRALARFLREHGFKSDPYPSSLDLLAVLRAEAGPEHDQLITDLIERITFWDLRVTGSKVEPAADGKWRVQIDVKATKLHATGDGKETEAPLDQAIDVGLFAADPAKTQLDAKDVIALEKRRIRSGDQSVELTVDRKPAFVGVDPYVKLISRDTTRNVVAVGP